MDFDVNANLYMDGTIALEIEHLLLMRLHGLNTVDDVEALKNKIHQLMMDMYNKGQEEARSAKV